jgi:hypothetical protein
MAEGKPIILDEETFENRIKAFQNELEQLLNKYNISLIAVPTISQVPVGNVVVNSMDAQIQLIDKTTLQGN